MSTSPALPVTAHQLGLTSPKRAHGAALLALGLFLSVVLLVRVPDLVAEAQAGGLTSFDRLAVLLSRMLPAAAALVAALALLYRGAVAALAFFVPAGAPAHIRGQNQVITQLLVHRVIEDTYLRPTGLIQLVLSRLFPRIVYLTPPFRPLVAGFLIPALLFPMAVAVWVVTGVFPGWLLLCGFLTLAALTTAILVSRTGLPGIHIYQQRLQLTEAGNPADLFNHVRVCLDGLREGAFPNRVLQEEPPQVGILASINHFEAAARIETQPLPVTTARGIPLNALLLDVAAVVLGVFGWSLLLFTSAQPAPFPSREFLELNRAYLFAVVAGLVTLESSRRLLRMAYCLYNTFRFRSDVIWLKFVGTYTASKIGLGDGRGGQFFSHRDRIQSDVLVELFATRVISECTVRQASAEPEPVHSATVGEAALASPRYIVEAVLDPHLGHRLAYLIDHLRSFRDSSNTLADVRIAAPSVGEILGANLQLTAQTEAARVSGAQRALGPPAPTQGSGVLPAPAQAAGPLPPQPAAQPQLVPVTVVPAPHAPPAVRIIACPRCGQHYRALSGQRARFQCSNCRQVFDAVVP